MIVLQNETGLNKIKPIYSIVIEKAIDQFKEAYGNLILEIRLQGSVPRGEEIENVSDIDFLCILKGDSPAEKKAEIINAEKHLITYCKSLVRVDMNVTNERIIDNDYGYYLLVISDSLSVFGSNKYYRKSLEISGHELSNLWNPNIRIILNRYEDSIICTENSVVIRDLSKLIGKDTLKSFRTHLMRKYEIFSRTIEGTSKDLITFYPKYKKLFAELLGLYLKPSSNKKENLIMIDRIRDVMIYFK